MGELNVQADMSGKTHALMRVHSSGPIISLVLSIFLTFMFFPIMFFYWVWIFFDTTHYHGSRASKWFRGLEIWKMWCNYFPIRLVKTVDLSPEKNYIFGYHPHGVISCGAFGAFGTDGCDFSKQFPGIEPRLLTLTPWFKLPFWREICLSLGLADARRSSFKHILQKSGGGASVAIPVGGAPEALQSHPGTYDILLEDKKGFVKVALENGATLVPTFGFGETDLYTQKPNERNSELRDWQQKVLDMTGFAPVQLTNTRGMMPMHGLVTVVVGEPIDCPQLDKPDIETINKYHAKYCEGLKKIYNDNKDKYAANRKASLALLGTYHPKQKKVQ